MKIAPLIFLEILVSATLWAGAPFSDSTAPIAGFSDEVEAAESATAPYVIFSNLDSEKGNRFNTNPFGALPVAGKTALGNQTESWDAVRFSPKVDVQAKTLAAAIGYISGTKRVNLGIYANNEITGSVGVVLPGGQASTTAIPELGQCCQLAKVTLPGEGVTLSAGTVYWLVASPDNSSAPDFSGGWQTSNRPMYAAILPPDPWQDQSGIWPAAEIRGTRIRVPNSNRAHTSNLESDAQAPDAIIFSNLNRTSDTPYFFGDGIGIYGDEVPFQPEIWLAFPFTPTSDFHAKTLAAAIAWQSGTKLINLGIYSDEGGKVGIPLPGGEVITSDIPELGDCCELTQARLPAAGVQLLAGIQYWLVARPDDARAPTFKGVWQGSSLALNAYQEPENFINWTNFDGNWLAAEIRGTSP